MTSDKATAHAWTGISFRKAMEVGQKQHGTVLSCSYMAKPNVVSRESPARAPTANEENHFKEPIQIFDFIEQFGSGKGREDQKIKEQD